MWNVVPGDCIVAMTGDECRLFLASMSRRCRVGGLPLRCESALMKWTPPTPETASQCAKPGERVSR